MEERPRVEGTICSVVCGRKTEHFGELPRSASLWSAAKQGGTDLGRRAGREKNVDLPPVASRSLQVCECFEAEPCQNGRTRHHLHADVPGSSNRDASVCATRHHSLGGLWRIQF